MIHNDTDTIVVGAGPAGSIAALCLARAGVRVRLLDRATFPRDKLCGDTLNPGSLAILDRIALGARVRERAIPTLGMTVTGPGGASVRADYPAGLAGAAIRRRDLDLLLLDAAISAGVQFEPGVAVQEPLQSSDAASGVSRPHDRVAGVRVINSANGERTSTRCSARMVIAADGRGSRLASTLKLARFAASPRRWAYGAYFLGIDGLTTYGEMHVRGDGYIGIAPLPDGVANVCVVNTPGVIVSGDRGRISHPVSFDRVIADAIAADPLLRERFANARQVSAITVLGPLAVESQAAGCPGLLLAGDAAGFIDPMTGDGLRFALRGGELAAEAALRELESGLPSHRALARARAREFSAKYRLNRALRGLVGSPRALQLAALVSRYWTGPVEYLIGLAGDVRLAQRSG